MSAGERRGPQRAGPGAGVGRRVEGAVGVAAEPERGSRGEARAAGRPGAARSLEPGPAQSLSWGGGTLGATFPAPGCQGRPRPPEPPRETTTLSAWFPRRWEVRESTGNGEGKVLNWGSSGSRRGACGERAAAPDSSLGVARTRRGQRARRHFVSRNVTD